MSKFQKRTYLLFKINRAYSNSMMYHQQIAMCLFSNQGQKPKAFPFTILLFIRNSAQLRSKKNSSIFWKKGRRFMNVWVNQTRINFKKASMFSSEKVEKSKECLPRFEAKTISVQIWFWTILKWMSSSFLGQSKGPRSCFKLVSPILKTHHFSRWQFLSVFVSTLTNVRSSKTKLKSMS